MNLKSKILNWVYENNVEFFKSKFPEPTIDLEKVYESNKHFFELLSLKDFVGYIPKEINEPTLKCFEEFGESIERWILWQSWYINRKAMNEPLKIPFYSGMMVYMKVLYTMARVNKRVQVSPQRIKETEVETPWIDRALNDISSFNSELKKKNENNKDNKDSEIKDGGN